MKILVTGASSFTGKVVIPMLKDAGHEMVNLVRQDYGFDNQFFWNFTDELPVNIPECQAIIHLAAHVDFGKNYNILPFYINTISTAKLAAYALKKGAYFIFASMMGVHGSQTIFFDKTTPINPQNNYAMSKYIAEEILRSFSIKHSILRIGGIYGIGGPAHLGLNTSMSNAFYKKEIPILKGEGKAKRNYICVNDVARWIIYLLNKYEIDGLTPDLGLPETIYLAGPEIMTIEQYLKLIVEKLLPGNELQRINGPESKDMVINHTPFPFKPILFKDYLQSLNHTEVCVLSARVFDLIF